MNMDSREIGASLRSLHLGDAPVIVHASLSAFGQVAGGAQAVAAALDGAFPVVLAPAFTYKTMLTPGAGPAENGMTYGTEQDANRMAQFFTPDMPVDGLIGQVPEALRQLPNSQRSLHPILSFCGLRAAEFLEAQSLAQPFAPLEQLERAGGWVLLLGVNHTVNTSIHAAEARSGRRGFIRWALTPAGVVECPSFPGCSAGFEDLAPALRQNTRRVLIGSALVQALPLEILFEVVLGVLKNNPLALLCQQADCERCNQTRRLIGT